MGRKAKAKAERKAMGITGKKLHNIRHDAVPEMYTSVINGSNILLNPIKHLLKGEAYKDPTGIMATVQTVNRYNKYLKTNEKAKKVVQSDEL